MSFLDMQDLATAAAQPGIGQLLSDWYAQGDEFVGALEASLGALLAVVVLTRPRNAKGRRKPAPRAKP
jgi:hypothetical protein